MVSLQMVDPQLERLRFEQCLACQNFAKDHPRGEWCHASNSDIDPAIRFLESTCPIGLWDMRPEKPKEPTTEPIQNCKRH
jgi:hypothetical protein